MRVAWGSDGAAWVSQDDRLVWRAAVELHAARRPRVAGRPPGIWGDINDNSTREPPRQCTVCNMRVCQDMLAGELPPPTVGDEVECLIGDPKGEWTPERVVRALVIGEHCMESDVKGLWRVLVRFTWEGSEQEKYKDVRHLGEAGRGRCDHLHGTTLVPIHGILPEDYYDFQLHDIWDVVKLFTPYGKVDFKKDFNAHDSSNLLVMLESICTHGELKKVKEATAQVRMNARNVWAHQGARMSMHEFNGAMQRVETLASLTGDTNTERWQKVWARRGAIQTE